MALVAVGLGDEERRALAAARAGNELAGGLVHLAHVEAVHAHTGDAVSLGALADVLDRELALDWQALGVLVDLADVHDRQLPERREVRGLVEPALVRRAVAEERDRDLIGAELLGREGGARRDRDPATHDAVRAEIALRRVGDVHRSAATTAVSGLAPEELRVHPAKIGALRNAVAVAAMRRRDPVVIAQVRTYADSDRLLARVRVDRPPHLALGEQRTRSLFEVANAAHDAVQVERGLLVHHTSCSVHSPVGCSITRIAPSRRSRKVCQASAN